MRSIFLDDRFYSRCAGSLIASPVELIVRYKRLISLETKMTTTPRNYRKY